jgi:hypothetical protein
LLDLCEQVCLKRVIGTAVVDVSQRYSPLLGALLARG